MGALQADGILSRPLWEGGNVRAHAVIGERHQGSPAGEMKPERPIRAYQTLKDVRLENP